VAGGVAVVLLSRPLSKAGKIGMSAQTDSVKEQFFARPVKKNKKPGDSPIQTKRSWDPTRVGGRPTKLLPPTKVGEKNCQQPGQIPFSIDPCLTRAGEWLIPSNRQRWRSMDRMGDGRWSKKKRSPVCRRSVWAGARWF